MAAASRTSNSPSPSRPAGSSRAPARVAGTGDAANRFSEALAGSKLPPDLSGTTKLAYLRHVFRADPNLPDDLNGFQRDWLFQFLISALLAEAASNGRPVDAVAAELLAEERLEVVFHGVIDDLFGAIPPSPQDDEESGDPDAEDAADDLGNPQGDNATVNGGGPGGTGHSRLQQALLLHLARPIVRERLPFASLAVISADDPYCSPERAAQLASAWGSATFAIGGCGHINGDSGLGDWPQGRVLMHELLRRSDH